MMYIKFCIPEKKTREKKNYGQKMTGHKKDDLIISRSFFKWGIRH